MNFSEIFSIDVIPNQMGSVFTVGNIKNIYEVYSIKNANVSIKSELIKLP